MARTAKGPRWMVAGGFLLIGGMTQGGADHEAKRG